MSETLIRSRTWRSRLALVACGILGAVLLFAIAGCGDSSSDSSSSSEPATSESTESTESSFLNADVKTKLDEEVAELEERPTSIGITEPIKKPIPSGKTIAFVRCSVPACTGQDVYFTEAAEKVGWKLVPVNSGLTAETIKNAWEQVVQGDFDAVISSAAPVAAYSKQLAELKAKGVPVVNVFSGGDTAGSNGIIDPPIAGNDFFPRAGETLAKYVLAHSTTAPNAAMFLTDAYGNNTLMAEGFEKEMKKSCPECETELVQVPLTAIGTNALAQTVTSYSQANPDVDWAFPAWNDLVTGVPAAMRGAGLAGQVKFVTLQAFGSTTANEYLENGEELVAMTPVPGPDAQWRAIDELIRYFNGESTAEDGNEGLEPWLITKEAMENEGLADEYEGTFPTVKDFKQQFEKLWGV